MVENRTPSQSSLKETYFMGKNAHFFGIHQQLLRLNLLEDLPAFTTKKYTSQEYFKAFEYASLHTISIKQGCLLMRAMGKKAPSPEQVMKCCRKNSAIKMTEFVNKALACQFNALPKKIRQQFRKSGIVFIDFHKDCYYGDRTNPHIRKSKVKQSTDCFYEYLTADLYSKYGSFTIAILHRPPKIKIPLLMKEMLHFIECVISPKIIVFDGEFAILDVLNLLLRKNIKFIARKARTKRIKEMFQRIETSSEEIRIHQWQDFNMHSRWSKTKDISVQICPQRIMNEFRALIKSTDWKISPKTAKKLYRKRFAIETGYRDKHKFQIFTCTKILSTRLLFLLFSALLWNCWQSFLIWEHLLTGYYRNSFRDKTIWFSSIWIIYFLRRMIDI